MRVRYRFQLKELFDHYRFRKLRIGFELNIERGHEFHNYYGARVEDICGSFCEEDKLDLHTWCWKLDKHEAANVYADAAHCYKKTNTKESILCLEQSVNLFLEIGRLNMSARYYKEIAELYEQEQNLEKAIKMLESPRGLPPR